MRQIAIKYCDELERRVNTSIRTKAVHKMTNSRKSGNGKFHSCFKTFW